MVGATCAVVARLRHRIGQLFERYDVVLTPTTALPAPEIGYVDGLNRWRTNRFAVAKWSCLSMPRGSGASTPASARVWYCWASMPILYNS
jgi:Asp-tRNA(Asn)/Glu-tRNA(Gln) amidotransferase A subunit family amidase